jgi:hypothetical protein
VFVRSAVSRHCALCGKAGGATNGPRRATNDVKRGDELVKRAKKGDELAVLGLGEVPSGWKNSFRTLKVSSEMGEGKRRSLNATTTIRVAVFGLSQTASMGDVSCICSPLI